MPEAAEAIRRLKQVVQKEVTPDDQPTAHSSHLSNGSKSKDAIQGSSVNSLVSSVMYSVKSELSLTYTKA
ncbi:hypothetical protein JHK87_010524 [Glycine soja]|nr:hypothetical protein JHK87_010524 [Glycine soja]